jgi:hypothetical protein
MGAGRAEQLIRQADLGGRAGIAGIDPALKRGAVGRYVRDQATSFI